MSRQSRCIYVNGMKGLRLKRRILFISFQVVEDLMFLCAFNYVRDITVYCRIHLIAKFDKENGSDLLSIYLWMDVTPFGAVSSC